MRTSQGFALEASEHCSDPSAVKTLILAALVAVVPIVSTASEFVVLNFNKQSVTVAPTDIVQVVSVLQGSGAKNLEFMFADGGPNAWLYIAGGQGMAVQPNVVMTGLTQVGFILGTGERVAVTLKITKAADEMVSQPILLPPATDGVYSLSMETSTDLENWAPAAPGDFLGTSSHRFFRLKAVRKPQTPP
jgi:hypothetical protein